MCVIYVLKPGQMPELSAFENSVWNNWHGYGLVTKVDGKLDIQRKAYPDDGKEEISPEEIYKLLEKNKKYERFLHLRHTTAGLTNLDNAHPFEILFDEKSGRHIVFMHNGTLESYKSKKYDTKGCLVDDDDGPSDTKNFCDEVLIPYVSALNFGTGIGDIHHPKFRKLVVKFWQSTSRGLLIASDQASAQIGQWKTIPCANGKGEIIVSNDDYFKDVIRGPEKARRLIMQEKLRKSQVSSKSTGVVRLSDIEINAKHDFYSLSENLGNITGDWDFWDRESTTAIGYASKDELEELYEDKKNCITVMDWVFTDYAKLYEEYLDLEDKHQKATKMIATMKKEAA